MPHIDDGTLHAYLDGAVDALAQAGALPEGVTRAGIDAHFALCADCRSRLEAERDIRERAGIVLRDAEPAYAAPPPFVATRAPRRTWLPLTWAATVLLAVGAGWWGREIAGAPGAGSPAPAAESQDVRSRAAADQDYAAPPSPEPAPAAAQSEQGGALSQAAPDAARREQSGTRSQDAAAAPERVARSEPPPQVAAGTTATADIASADAPVRSQANSTDSAVRSAPMADPDRLSAAPRFTPVAPAAPPPPAASPPPPPAPAVVELPADLKQRLAPGDSLRWVPLTRPAPAALRIADAAQTSLATLPYVGYTITRVEQRLDSGERLQVITVEERGVTLDEVVVTGAVSRDSAAPRPPAREQKPQAAAAESAAPPGPTAQQVIRLADGTSELTMKLPDGRTVILRGMVSAARLRELAATLVPAR